MWIAIDEEGWDAAGGEAGGEIDAGCGFPYSALLVGDGNDPRHGYSGQPEMERRRLPMWTRLRVTGGRSGRQWRKSCARLWIRWISAESCAELRNGARMGVHPEMWGGYAGKIHAPAAGRVFHVACHAIQ